MKLIIVNVVFGLIFILAGAYTISTATGLIVTGIMCFIGALCGSISLIIEEDK